MITTKEIWNPILGWEKLYHISNLGKIKSLLREVKGKSNSKYFKKERMLRLNKVGAGYLGAILCDMGRNKRILLHRLVAQSFIFNPENKPCVNHINGIKTDNNIKNLEWVTHKENSIHSYKIGLMPTKITENQANQIRQLYSTGKYKQSEIGGIFDLTQGTIGKIIRNELWIN